MLLAQARLRMDEGTTAVHKDHNNSSGIERNNIARACEQACLLFIFETGRM